MKISPDYYTPSQVAGLYSIKKDTLLFYDRIGLFCPDVRAANGYRLYSSSSLAELEAILSLKDLGFSLSDIKSIISGNSLQAFLNLLQKESRAAEEKIRTLRMRQRVCSSLHSRISRAIGKKESELYAEYFPPVSICKLAVENTSEETSTELWDRTYYELLAKAGRTKISNAGSIIPLEKARRGNPFYVSHLYAVTAEKTHEQIPAGDYAYMYFYGPYENVVSRYAHFFSLLEEHSLTASGDIFEELIVDTRITRRPEEFITQIRVRITG